MTRRFPLPALLLGCLALLGPTATPGYAKEGCNMDGLTRSLCVVELLVDDIKTNYDGIGGGGISEIKQLSSSRYSVSILQEERVDVLTYTLAFEGDDSIKIEQRTVSTE